MEDSQLNRSRRKSMENMELVKLTPDKVLSHVSGTVDVSKQVNLYGISS